MRSILIAAKQLELAKTRLANVLPPGERIALADAMFRDVLAAATRSRMAEQIAVVSSDRALLGYVRDAGAFTSGGK